MEWPVVLMGAFEQAYLDVPGEVIRATIRANQKCFVLRGADGKLANRFLLISNIVPKDGGAVIINGNERVIRARLSDAKFFWETDKRVWAEDKGFARLEKFRNVTFHEKLGSSGTGSSGSVRWRRNSAPSPGRTRRRSISPRASARRICKPRSWANSRKCRA